MANNKTPRKTIELALQGGGAHGALTWGVLDRLLEEPALHIEGVSGTSAGAMNAVVLADGLEAGGAEGARAALERFWKAVSDAAVSSPIQRDLWSRINGDWGLENSPSYVFFDHLSRVFSPYELNPLNLNPLRDLAADIIDFDRVNRCTAIKVFVTATNVRSGRPRVFRQPELSVDAVMASAALPFMFQAVEIDGEAYWDGGFTANPAVYPLIYDCTTPDILLVLLNPLRHPDAPRSAEEIANRSMELGFSTTFLREMRTLGQARAYMQEGSGWLPRGRLERKIAGLRFHLLEAEELADAGKGSKLNATRAFLHELRDLGRARAARWIRQHRADVGRRETVEVAEVFA